MKLTITAILAAVSLAACAPTPSAIAPVSMGGAYTHMNCQQAANELAIERTNLANLSSAQDAAVVGDAIGVFLVLVPVSSLTGSNHAGEIGASKGKIDALQARVSECG